MTWEDQGLWFTLILNGIALAIMVPLAYCCTHSRRLHISRIYRPNHTSDPKTLKNKNNNKKGNNKKDDNNNDDYNDAIRREANGEEDDGRHGVKIPPFDGGDNSQGTIVDQKSSLFSFPHIRRFLRIGETDWEESDEPILHDPQIDLILFFLKICFVIFFILAFLSVAWIFVVCLTDDYVQTFTIEQDPSECRKENWIDCDDKSYLCGWNNSTVPWNGKNTTGGCYPIAHNGLYDLSVQNLTPRAARLWACGILALLFAILCGLLLFFSIRSVTTYVMRIMKQQASVAIGYRTVLVKGLCKKQDKNAPSIPLASPEDFKQLYLNAETYFDSSDATVRIGGFGGSKLRQNDLYLFQGSTSNKISTKAEEIVLPRCAPKNIYKKLSNYRDTKQSLQDAVAAQERYWAALDVERQIAYEDLKSKGVVFTPETSKPPLMGTAFPKCCCCKVPLVEHYTNKLREATAELNEAISEVPEQDLGGYAFIVFKDASSAFEFVELFNNKFAGICRSASARIAGPYEGLEQCNLEKNKFVAWFLFLIVTIIFILLVFFWSIPVGFLGSLSSLASIPGIGPAFQAFIDVLPTTIVGILTAYLPLIVLIIFNIVLPIIITMFVRIGGSMTQGETNNSLMFQYYIFLVMTGVVIQAALQGGLFQLAAIVSNPTQDAVFAFIIAIVSPQGGYWYATVIGAGCLSMWLGALLLGPIILSTLLAKRSTYQRQYNGFFAHQDYLFAIRFAIHCVYASIGMFFHFTVPLLSVFVGIYFLNAYCVTRGLLFDTYRSSLPTMSLVTNFGLLVTALRVLGFTYVVGAVGAALTIGLKKHFGAMVLCIIAAVFAGIVFIYILYMSSKWRPNVALVRGWQDGAAAEASNVKMFSSGKKASESEDGPSGDTEMTLAEKQEAEEKMKSADPNDCLEKPYHAEHAQLQPVDAEAIITEAMNKDYSMCMIWHDLEIKTKLREDYEKDRIKAGNKLSKDIEKGKHKPDSSSA